ncbi:MAG TPA: hypothetical protein VFV96_12285 [Verrucomicrobiae bacterium]|nr:hypothetical protein [Verrucomicrobiae bacterium]
MKTRYTVLFCSAMIALVGCNSSETTGETPTTNAPAATNAQPDKPAAGAAAAIMEGKTEFVASAEAQLNTLRGQIDDLAQRSQSLTGEVKAQADAALATLKTQQSAAQAKFDALKQAGAGSWADLKAGLATALADLQKACDNAKAKFS